MSNSPRNAFEEAAQSKRQSFLSEVFAWLGANKKWWLLPIVIMMLLLGGILILSGKAGATAFIYTIF